MAQEPMVYKVKDIMQILGIGRDSAYNLTKQNLFPVIKNGNKTLIPKTAFHNWFNNLAS